MNNYEKNIKEIIKSIDKTYKNDYNKKCIVINTLNEFNNMYINQKKNILEKLSNIKNTVCLNEKLRLVKKQINIVNIKIDTYYNKLINIINKYIKIINSFYIKKNINIKHIYLIDKKINLLKNKLKNVEYKRRIFNNIRLQEIDTISGPISLSYYKNIQGKQILILGDWHMYKKLCSDKNATDEDEYISILSKSLPKNNCLDLFVEHSYNINNKKMVGGNMIEITDSPLVNNVAWFHTNNNAHIRYHYIDTRSFIKQNDKYQIIGETVLTTINIYIYNNKIAKKTILKNIKKIDYKVIMKVNNNYKKIIKMLVGFDYTKEILNLYVEFIMEIKKIFYIKYKYELYLKKENIEKYILITNKLINKELEKIIIYEKNKKIIINKEIIKEKIYDTIITNINTVIKDNNEYERIGYLLSIDFCTYIQDVYTFLRMFIKFDKNKLGRAGSSCINSTSETMNNIVISCGDTHRKHLILLIKSIFNKDQDIYVNNEFNYENNTYSQCIKLKHPINFNNDAIYKK